jgi:gp45 sliding clamp, C terminal
MKISKETLAILKNFASINSNLLLKPGGLLTTMNVQKNVSAEAKIVEDFPLEFGIYDTNEFLGVISLFSEPEIEFKEKYAIFKEGSSSVKFYSADSSVLTVPTKPIKFPATDIEFDLTATQLASIQKTAAVLRAVDVSVVGKDGVLSVSVGDLKNLTSNAYNIDIGETDVEFTANLKIENLKMMSQDYKVSISAKKISRFTSTDGNMQVYVALESTSEFPK